MDKLRIALIQPVIAWENHEENRRNIGSMIAGLSAIADLLILPEMFNTGFSMKPGAISEEAGGKTLDWMKSISASRNCAIAGSLNISDGGSYYNRMYFIDSGNVSAEYDKRHLFSMAGEGRAYTAGTSRKTVTFRGWKIGLNICYDLRFPVFSRRCPGFDFDLLINSANWPETRSSHWRALLPARAIENQAYVAGVNRAGSDENGFSYKGESAAYDFLGNQLVSAGHEAAVVTAELDPVSLSAYREKFPAWQDADDFTINS